MIKAYQKKRIYLLAFLFVMCVPLVSSEFNVYLVRADTTTSYITTLESAGSWSSENEVDGSDDAVCMFTTSADAVSGEFSFTIDFDDSHTVDGITFRLHDNIHSGSDEITVELYDDTSTWRSKTSGTMTSTGGACSDAQDQTIGGASDLWGGTWSRAHIESTAFRVRFTSTSMIGSWEAIDYVEVTITHSAGGGDSTPPEFPNYTGSTNNSNVELGTSFLGNWSIIDETGADTYIIYSNSTGANVSKTSGVYTNNTYHSWSFDNTNISNVGLPIFIEIWANDTSNNWNSSIMYVDIVDTTDPTFSYVGTTNNSQVEYGTSIIGNWSITELAPSTYIIYSNTTGVNASKTSGSYNNGDYKTWTFDNDNTSLIGLTLFIEIWANDSSSNYNSSIVYITIVDTTNPSFSYAGSTNNSQIDYLTSITGNWSITEIDPVTYIIYSNTTGVNVSKTSGSYNNGDYKSWVFDNDNLTLVGSVIFIEIWANDTSSNWASSIVYFTISEAIDPVFNYVGTTNSSTIELGTSIIGNWSITDISASNYFIYANTTGSNVSKASGSYNSGDYKSWTFDNDNSSLVDLTFYIQIWSNDTWGNSATSIVYFTIEDTTNPAYSYVGTTNNSQVDYLTGITGNWSITDLAPSTFIIYANNTGVNASKTSGSFNNGDYKTWTFDNDNISLVGSTIFLQIWANDTSSNSASSIVYFTISEAVKPDFTYAGTANSSTIELNTSITGNWSITDTSASYYYIFSNTTGVNATKASGSYNSGDYKTWTFDNDNSSLVDLTFYIQIWANDTYGNTNTSIVYFTIEDTTNPAVVYGGTTNGTELDIGTSITGSWDITELAPSYYFIYSNTTGSNVSKASGSYLDGDTKSWVFDNTNCSLGSATIYIQIWLNDTSGNVITSIVFFDIINDAPVLVYTGTANSSVLEWESGGSFTASWTITEDSPHLYFLFWNQTGSNTTWQSGTYTSSVTKSYDPVLADVGKVIWIQLVLNDTCGEEATETYFFSVTNTDAPTVTVMTPTNSSYASQLIEIWISSSNGDLDTLSWSLFYGNGTLYEGNVTWTETVLRTLSTDGLYYITAYANDTAGLEDSDTTYFTMAESVIVVAGQGVPKPDSNIPEIPDSTGSLGTVNTLLPQLLVLGFVGAFLYGLYWFFNQYEPEPDKAYVLARKKTKKLVQGIEQYFSKNKG